MLTRRNVKLHLENRHRIKMDDSIKVTGIIPWFHQLKGRQISPSLSLSLSLSLSALQKRCIPGLIKDSSAPTNWWSVVRSMQWCEYVGRELSLMHMEEGELVICQEYSPIKEQILSSQCSISHDKTSPRNVWVNCWWQQVRCFNARSEKWCASVATRYYDMTAPLPCQTLHTVSFWHINLSSIQHCQVNQIVVALTFSCISDP
jgi:hypothetical protein